jgi:hypothetical protein
MQTESSMQQAAARITQRSQAAAQLAADRSLQSAVCIGIIATLPCAFYSLLSAVCIGNIVI